MISIISCTNRQESLSYQVSLIYRELLVAMGEQVEIIDLEKLPENFVFSALYNNSGKNTDFNIFQDKIRSSEKYVFVIPEYNGSFPGVIKAFIDGLSYPSPLKNKVAGLVGISSGIQGGTLALSHFTDILHYLDCNVLSIKPKCTQIEAKLNTGKIEDKLFSDLLKSQAKALIAFNY